MAEYITRDVYNLIIDDLKQLLNKKIHIIIVKHKKSNTYEAKITGIYNNFFYVESKINSYMEAFSIQYCDIISKKISIVELNKILEEKGIKL